MYKEVLSGGYIYHDMMLGTLLQLAREDTTVILMSDHGFHPDHLRVQHIPNEPAGPAEEHREFGIFVMKGPGIKKDELVYGTTLLDVTPTILQLFDLPIAKDMDGLPQLQAWEETPKPEYIDSWEERAGEDGRHPADTRMDPVEVRESLEQLIALGYIERPDENADVAVKETIRELRYNLARAYSGANRLVEAAGLFEELWEEWPEESRFGVHLFNNQLQRQETAAARQTFEKLIERKKAYAIKAAEELKQWQEENKDTQPEDLDEKTKRKIHKLRARASTNLHSLAFHQARLLRALGRLDDAVELFAKAAEIQTHNRPSLHQQVGDTLLQRGRLDEAAAEFEKILKLDDENASAYLGLARCHLRRHRDIEAASNALKAIGLQFHNPRAHFYYGLALERIGKPGPAAQAYERAVIQNPVFPAAHRRLARIYDKAMKLPELAEKHRNLASQALEQIRRFRRGEFRPAGRAEAVQPFASPAALAIEPILGRLEGVAAGEIVTVVSGLPRSGTSLMMQMLAAGGLEALTDDQRAADENNQRGYFELEKVKKLGKENAWLQEARGKSVKIIAQLLPRIPAGLPCRVIFMMRDLHEVLRSQRKMIANLGEKGARLSDEDLTRQFTNQLKRLIQWLQLRDQTEVLFVDYGQTVKDPATQAATIADFLKHPGLDPQAMAQAVDPSLHREKRGG